jgi:hypothetical protein
MSTTCANCRGKGYIVGSALCDDGEHKTFSKCSKDGCPHSQKYYIFIKNRYAKPKDDNVIHVDFMKRRVEKDVEKDIK